MLPGTLVGSAFGRYLIMNRSWSLPVLLAAAACASVPSTPPRPRPIPDQKIAEADGRVRLAREEWFLKRRQEADGTVPVDAFGRAQERWRAWSLSHGAGKAAGASPFDGRIWQEIGPRNIAGRVLSVAFDPNDSVGVIDSYFPEANFFVRTASTSLQKFATDAGMAPLPPPPENFFASSLLICSSGLSFCVAATNARTEALSGASFNFEKFDALGDAGRSECRKTLSSRCLVGSHCRKASICFSGAPGTT